MIDLVTSLVTREQIIDLSNADDSNGINALLALDRLGSGKAFMGLLKKFGLRRGAFGSTLCWDTGDMVVVGCDALSMETVIGRLRELGGGMVYAIGKESASELAAPLCGVLSLDPIDHLARSLTRMEVLLKENGVIVEKPTWTLDTLTTPAIPHLRITHRGYVRVKDRKLLSCEVREGEE